MKESEKFSDDLDRASYLEIEATNAAIAAARNSKEEVEIDENCNYCGAPLLSKRKFCNKDCAEDFELLKKRKRQNVKVY